MVTPFRLQSGDAAPRQQSPTTCGSASLTVARMLADPWFARWIRLGLARDAGEDAEPVPALDVTASERFAAYEQVVVGRTNGLFGGAGRLQLPWPRALGTPPWGARHELELGASDPGADYRTSWTRFRGPEHRAATYRVLRERAGEGRPALLYVGSLWLPRHVVLVLSGRGAALDVYEPASGQVLSVTKDRFVAGRVGLAGWNLPWAVISARSGQKE